jgi:hypothetical protein
MGLMGRALAAAVAVLVVFGLAGCSSGHKSSGSVTTTSSSTTTSAPTTTTASSSTTKSSTTTTSPQTATTKQSVTVRISGISVSPSSPVSCNAPTQIELKWTATLATSVDLSIDGTRFATYNGGAQDHLEYFACDGKPHTYTLTARSGSASAIASRVVTSTPG